LAQRGLVRYEPRSSETAREIANYPLEIIAKLATVLEVEPAELLRISSGPNT
jgi:hypothetical protein